MRRLTERDELVGERRLQVVQHRLEPFRRKEDERLDVLLPGRGVERVHRGGCREQPIFRREADDGLVQGHRSSLHAGPPCELPRLAREPPVEQTVQTFLDQVRHLCGGDGDGDGDGRNVTSIA